jgi:hypothetical protein
MPNSGAKRLKYNIKMKQNMYCVCHNYLFEIFEIMMDTLKVKRITILQDNKLRDISAFHLTKLPARGIKLRRVSVTR